jgi:exoribonuclease R
MAPNPLRAPVESPPFREAFARIRAQFGVPTTFPPEVESEARAVVERGVVSTPRIDARDIAFVTIDPLGSKDLDQAFHAEKRGDGFRVHYAIADVAAFVTAGSALDRESFARGVTLYLPDGRAPMLPDTLGEGAASLLPNDDRPALLWTIDLDPHGERTDARLERAIVRSRAALDYPSVQQHLDADTADEPLQLLRDIGIRRRELEAARGGFSLDLPSQDVVPAADGTFDLVYTAPLPVEGWNAQISLLTGMEAARLMVEARAGILRTLPPPQQFLLDRLRRTARALHVAWPKDSSWADVVRNLDRTRPDDAAFLIQASHVLRGAGYVKLDAATTSDPTAIPIHAGVGAPYAHVTAPLRRLADRYANEIVVAHCAGATPPEWAVAALDSLVETMEKATQRSAGIEHAAVDAVECAVLAGHIGQRFDAIVVDQNQHGAIVQLPRPAVVAPVAAHLALGDEITVKVTAVDPVARRVSLEPDTPPPA